MTRVEMVERLEQPLKRPGQIFKGEILRRDGGGVDSI
jgi:hypothetical protein